MAIGFVVLSFMPFYKMIFSNLVANYGLKKETVREFVRNRNVRLAPMTHDQEIDRILSLIPKCEHKEILLHGTTEFDIILASGESPRQRFFSFQNWEISLAPFKQEITAYFKHNPPKWLIVKVDKEDEFIQSILKDYEFVTFSERKVVYHLKALN